VTTLAVVIPATDMPATLARALAAVHRATDPPEEVIVVDRPTHLVSAAARNLGARRAGGEILVFVDADVEVHADAFIRIRAAFDDHPELTAVFGAYDDEPAGASLVSDFRNLLHHHVHHQGVGPATTFWTGLGAVRRDAFLSIGGFDETLAWIRDIEFGMRLRRSGGVIVLDPSIQAKHLKRWTLVSMLETDLLRRGVPWLRLILDGRADSTTLNLSWRHRVGAGASVVLVVALARRNLRLAATALAVLPVVDRDFYALLLRRGGPRMLAAGVPLHVLHRLTAVAAVPVALTGHVLDRRKRRRAERD
jgi:cellulose synthase/poly-beta-1,6-N-acetylglucosamine synthase-like glycosyltransferase